MDAVVESAFGALPDWQAMLERHRELFSEMLPGSRIGIVPREGSGILPGKHLAGLAAAGGGSAQMLTWEVCEHGLHAALEAFRGFEQARVDLLLVADEAALESLQSVLGGDTLSAMKRMIRQGSIMFYVLKTKYQLQDAGYEDFLDSLGLAFLGACR